MVENPPSKLQMLRYWQGNAQSSVSKFCTPTNLQNTCSAPEKIQKRKAQMKWKEPAPICKFSIFCSLKSKRKGTKIKVFFSLKSISQQLHLQILIFITEPNILHLFWWWYLTSAISHYHIPTSCMLMLWEREKTKPNGPPIDYGQQQSFPYCLQTISSWKLKLEYSLYREQCLLVYNVVKGTFLMTSKFFLRVIWP